MKCVLCQSEHPEGARFCSACGASLSQACANCGFRCAAGDRYCGGCGRSLGPSPESRAPSFAADGERRHITVLFSDLCGYTALSETLDPEELRELIGWIFGRIEQVVSRHEGTIERFIGDAVMALFGVPRACENHAVRAVRAAREIHDAVSSATPRFIERIGLPLAMHSGVNTGLVVTGEVDLRRGMHGVTGHAINVAARLQGLADRGEVLVGEETFQHAEGYFIFERLEPRKVKERETPVAAYRVIAPSASGTRFDLSIGRGLTPLVGRRHELRRLMEGYRRAAAGEGNAFAVLSEAGGGKSRLLYEFRKSIAGEDITYLEARCLSHGRHMAYRPVTDILKSAFDIQEEDDHDLLAAKALRGLGALGIPPEGTLPFVLELLSARDSGLDAVSLSPEARKDRTLDALTRIVLRNSASRPLVLALEDLQWMDASSADFLGRLLDLIPQARVLLLCTSRPGGIRLGGREAIPVPVLLERLSIEESAAMSAHLLETGGLDRDLESLIFEKTGGVPLFIEEFLRSLKEIGAIRRNRETSSLAGGFERTRIPSTVQDVILARVDALPKGAREVLQAGSAIEREFNYTLLRLVSALPEPELLSHLSALTEAELIYRRGSFPRAAYVFRHALTREAVYQTILSDRRRLLHEAVARAMEALHWERMEEHAGIIAAHFLEAGKVEEASGYLKLAGKRAQKAASFGEAIDFAARRIRCLEQLPDTQDRTRDLIEARTMLAGYHLSLSRFSEAKAALDPVLPAALAGSFPERMAGIHMVLGLYSHWVKEDQSETLRHLTEGIRSAESFEDQASLWFGNFFLGIALSWNCKFERAMEYFDRSIAVSRTANNLIGLCFSKGNMSAFHHMFSGRIHLAFETGREALRIAEDIGDIYVQGMACAAFGTACYCRGLFDRAEELLLKGREFCEKTSMAAWEAWACGFLGHLYCDMQEYEKAGSWFDRAIALLEKGDLLPSWLHHTRISGIRARAMAGGNCADLNELYGHFGKIRLKAAVGWAGRYVGEILMRLGKPFYPEAGIWLERAAAADRQNGVRLSLGCDHYTMARLGGLKGNRSMEVENLERAAAVFRECGAEGYAARTEQRLAVID